MPLFELLEVSGPAAARGGNPTAAAPAPLTRSDLSAPSLLAILKRKPLLCTGHYPDGTAFIIALDGEWAGRAPAGANVWTIEEIALAATVTPDQLAWVHRQKRRTDLDAPVTVAPDEPPVPDEFRLAPDAANPLPEGAMAQVRNLLEYHHPLLYAGYGNLGYHAGTGNRMPVPVFYARDEEARVTAPAAAEVWTPEELAYWGRLAPERRLAFRSWKQQHGRGAVIQPQGNQ